MDFFKNKYRIASARAPFWDYSRNASYFITICTKNNKPWLGQIENGEMQLSELGWIAFNCWMEIPQHFPFVVLDAFVIMPDHVHGIIKINKCGTVVRNPWVCPDWKNLQFLAGRKLSRPLRIRLNLSRIP